MIHPSSVIDDSAEIADGVEIGAFCLVGPNVKIGRGSVLKERVSITKNTVLGENNTVYSGTVLGGDPQDYSFDDQDVYCEIGNNNSFYEGVTINRGTVKDRGVTTLGDNNMFMAYSHVGHDCDLKNNITIANGVLLAGHVTLEEGVVMSGMTGAAQFVTIGRLAYIGGLTAVTQDVPPFVKAQGDVGKVRTLNNLGMKRAGVPLEVQRALREVFRIIWMSDLPLSDALEEVGQMENNYAEVKEMVDFLSRKSKSRWGRARETERTW
jgi:UDP-N-acetylglucosamine acyltransferase